MMSRGLLLIVLTLAFAGVAAADLSRTKTIKMDQYTVTAPATKGWKTTRDRRAQVITISKTDRASEVGQWINVIPQDISRQYATVHTKIWLGDDLVRREHANMIALGVMPGMYTLEDVEKFETDIDVKHGYAMRYRKEVVDAFTERGYLFVYFPPDFDEHGIVYKFLYASVGDEASVTEPDYTVFHFVIGSFKAQKRR